MQRNKEDSKDDGRKEHHKKFDFRNHMAKDDKRLKMHGSRQLGNAPGSNQKPNPKNNNWTKYQKPQNKIYRQNNFNQSYFSFTRLKNLSCNPNGNEIVSEIDRKEAEFKKFLSHEMNPDLLVLTIKVLRTVGRADFKNIVARVLIQVCSDDFLKILENHITKLSFETSFEKKKNAVYHQDRNGFWDNLNEVFKTIIELVPLTACYKLHPLLQKVKMVLKNIESNQNYKIEDKIKEASLKILNDVEFEISKFKEKNTKVAKTLFKEIITLEEEEPPEDFRVLNVVPTREDLFDENPFFRACKVNGAYDSVHHYLDVCFRLLREDFLIPLRSGLQQYLKDDKRHRNDDLRIYKNVKLMDLEISKNGIGNKMLFEKGKNWRCSKRFMFGSLVLLSRDDFKTIIFATVTGCDKRLMDRGIILIEACEGSKISSDLYGPNFVALESKIFFEPYYQVLKAMKNINPVNFPMEPYLIRAEARVKLPAYLRHRPVLRFKGHYDLPIGLENSWPTAKELDMDESQLNAFRNAITQEFAIIQGPPGTGKTFLASQIVRVLLENEETWRKHGPIIVVCLTNHALDQFLENTLAYTKSVVRVGSMSKSTILEEHSLMKRRETLCVRSQNGAMMKRAKERIESILDDLRKYRMCRRYLTTPNIIVPLNCLFDAFPSSQFKSDEEMVYWLTGLVASDSLHADSQIDLNFLEVDYFQETESKDDWSGEEDQNMFTDNDIIFDLSKIRNYSSSKATDPIELIDNQIMYIKSEMLELRNSEFGFMQFGEIQMLEDEIEMWNESRSLVEKEFANHVLLNINAEASDDSRWQAYWEWVKSSFEFVDQKILQLEAQYHKSKAELEEYRQLANLEVLQKHHIIGLTTSCAARIQETLRALRAPIVLVEEAAEILEAHVICSITEDCQHVILIGDHKQLRPKASVYELGIKYNLNISLFERMVNARGGECTQLAYQHRMRPEISRLITPSIYKTLYDHEIVTKYPKVIGLEKNVVFINHEEREQSYANEDSWMNVHEVKYILALAKHLLLQGYEPSDITILTTYSGQLFCFSDEVKHHEMLKDVRITTVDSFQGEESRIILLSLTRNNGRGIIGFLKEENRVCVALSRAKIGLIMLGNMNDLVVKNNIWPKIRDVLRKDESIGDSLITRCEVHPDQTFEMKTADDFKRCPQGGCGIMCNKELKCHHICPQVCHVIDQEHELYQCLEDCSKTCPTEHQHPCPSRCYEPCLPCKVKVVQQLPCGHSVGVPCHKDPKLFKCPVLYKCLKDCTKTNADCISKHMCQKKCYEDCDKCTFLVEKTRSCGHHYRNMPCSINVEEMICSKPCKRVLKCEHKCTLKCADKCGDCPVKVKKLSSCGHKVTVKCSEEATPAQCNGKCRKLLPCSHPCTKRCKEECSIKCEALVRLKEPGLCGHFISVPCYLSNTDPRSAALLKYCSEPCSEMLQCEHRCSGSCGQCHQGRIHTTCKESCKAIFICGHKCDMSCNMECLPCKKKCQLKCSHAKCFKACGQPCVRCKESCKYGCEHQRCTKRCYELCDIKPCEKPCPKMLKCGHPCVGFCGDSCPSLCRICNKDKFNNVDARFVLLPDCQHCIESNELKTHIESLSAPDQPIQVKTCPKCQTPIRSCMRFMNQIKKDLADLMLVKKKIFFQDKKDLEKRRKEYLEIILQMKSDSVTRKWPELGKAFLRLEQQRIAIKNQQSLIMSFYEINAFKNILDILVEIASIIKLIDKTRPYSYVVNQLNMLIECIPTTLQVSKQNLDDIQLELRRLHLMVKIQNTFTKDKIASNEKEYNNLINKISGTERFSEDLENKIIKSSVYLQKLNGDPLIVRQAIVNTVGLKIGFWFKCSKGHFFTMSECGGVMEPERCAECKTTKNH